jgi:leucyl aminopeptidase
MKTLIKKKTTISDKDNLILICDKKSNLKSFDFSKSELGFIEKQQKEKKEIIAINQYSRMIFVVTPKKEKNTNQHQENCRMLGDQLQGNLKDKKSVLIVDLKGNQREVLVIIEGMALANYTFITHKTEANPNKLETIYLCKNANKKDIDELQNIIDSVYLTRDLVNEPFSHLTAKDLAESAKKAGKNSGFKTTILNKKKIESLKMGGLLAVNKGSIDDPTFSIMEWKPKKATNKKPIVLVGKGIVYDTGGLSLKPTANSMDMMKVDMGGAGTVIGAMHAIAANKIPVHVIALVPATDNRPSGNAYAPGDVIYMHDDTSVEVLNTDAEGRLVLADALSFAKKYKPELVIDLATLTGAAAAAIGHFGIVSMHEGAEKEHATLKKIGQETHERLAEMPFWPDYDELIKSDVADIKNLGGPFGGAITAGKFLAHFADYPWIHLDIAGSTFVKAKYGYRGKGATGMGVRLLYHFIKNRA